MTPAAIKRSLLFLIFMGVYYAKMGRKVKIISGLPTPRKTDPENLT